MISIILASSSPYRKELLKRLKVSFEIIPPNVDEKKLERENAHDSSKRLALLKADVIAKKRPNSYIIGCDQTAECQGFQLEKPLNFPSAQKQLMSLSNKKVNFYSAVCLVNKTKKISYVDVVKFTVKYRKISEGQIKKYLNIEEPYDCVGSIKSEGLGISLLDEINSVDPTAIIGLPLITLSKMLSLENINYEE